MKINQSIISMFILFVFLHADEWTIDADHVYNFTFSPSSYHDVHLQIPLKAVKSATAISMNKTKGVIYPPAVALGPAVEITPQISLENIATLILPFEEGQLPLQDVQIGVWYSKSRDIAPIVIDKDQCKIDYKEKTVTLEIKNTGIYQVGTWQSLANNWPPANFHLESPSSGSSISLQQKNVSFSWQRAVDPNRDEVQYELIFAIDAQLTIPVATINCGNSNQKNIASSTMKTLLGDYLHTPLYWGVRASDKESSTLSLQNFVISLEGTRETQNSNLIFDYRSNWQYNDSENLDGTEWKKGISNWKSDSGSFGFGEWQKQIPNTEISKNRNTYYFYKSIELKNIPEAFTARVKYDDGFAFYVNGIPVHYQNIKEMPKYKDNAKEKSESLANFFIEKKYFVTGKNHIAVEVHQSGILSSDLAFDARLETGQNAVTITWGPWLTLPMNNSVTVVWETNQRAQAELHYGASKNLEQVVKGTKNGTLHKLVATGLQPGVTYYYKVVSAGIHSAVKTFIAPKTQDDHIKIGMYGDSRTFYSFHQVVVSAMAKHQPDIIVNSGDIIENGNRLHEWYEQFLAPASAAIDRIPYVACHGNHDGSINGNMWDFVPLPQNAPSPHDMYYYNFRYGPMVVMVIDTEAPYTKGTKQYNLLKNDLEKFHKSNWILAVFHRPAYSSGVGHGGEESPKIAEEIVVLLEQYGVDMVLNGHDHFYERSSKEGIQYVLSGGGGAPSTFGGYSLNPYSVTYDNFVLCYNILDMTPYSYTLKAYTPEGKVLDEITVDGRKPKIDVLQPEGAVEKIGKYKGKRQYYMDENSTAFHATKNTIFRIYFRAKDLDDDARISLYLDKDTEEGNSIEIASGISENDNRYFDWNVPSDLENGKYYIYASITDGENTTNDFSHFRIFVKE